MIRRIALTLATAISAIFVASSAADAQVEVDFPLGIGLRLPQYDRVNGLSLPYGPSVIFGDEKVVLVPIVTYRSNLGKFDPSFAAHVRIDTVFSLKLTGQRGTFSNENWIRQDILNSVWGLLFGIDTRNYYRADRGDARLSMRLANSSVEATTYAGVQFENAWSTGHRLGENREPFSFVGNKSVKNGFRRPNPVIDRGHISSGLAGTEVRFKNDRLTYTAAAQAEYGFKSPLGGSFTQMSMINEVQLQTFAGQQLELFGRILTTVGDSTPLQRYSYIGGSGTLSTIDQLELGGDRTYYFSALYKVPLPVPPAPFLGTPWIAPVFEMGAADVRKFGLPTQALGGRIGAGFIWLQYQKDLRTHQNVISGGVRFPQ